MSGAAGCGLARDLLRRRKMSIGPPPLQTKTGLRARRARGEAPYWALMLVPLAVLCVFYLYPMGRVLAVSVTEPRPGLQNYAELLSSSAIQRIVWTTLRICVVTTLVTLSLGYLVAYCILHVSERLRVSMLFLVLLSFWISILIRAFAWLVLLQTRGLVNTTLLALGIVDSPMPLIRNELGVMIGMVHYMIPYAVLPLVANMRAIDPRLVLAARGLGASPIAAFLKVYLPVSAPGLVSAGILVFIFALGFYITPALLGGGRVTMLSEYISVQIRETLNWGVGAMLASSLLIVIFLMLLLLARVLDLRRMFGTPA